MNRDYVTGRMYPVIQKHPNMSSPVEDYS